MCKAKLQKKSRKKEEKKEENFIQKKQT